MLYIVMAEAGEYSDRSVWITAVYCTEADARAAMQSAIERRGAWEQWYESRPPIGFNATRSAHAALEPPKELGERFQIVQIEPGKWFGDGPDVDEFR